MAIKRLGWKLGLTKEKRQELSDVICVEDKVAKKEKVPNLFAYGSAEWFAAGGDKCCVTLAGSNVSFTLNPWHELNSYNEGEKVRVAYREVHTITLDYVPPDFEAKKAVERKLAGYELVKTEKIENSE